MGDKSDIEWTDATWNPVRGCVKISPGCKHCYAETFAERWRGIPGHPYEQGFDLRLVPELLDRPLRWQKPRRIFVNSMSDLFHEGAPFEYIAAVFGVMAATPRHTYQVLTKRADRMLEFFRWVDLNRENFDEGAEIDLCLGQAALNLPPDSSPAWDKSLTMAGLIAPNDEPADAGTWPLPNVLCGVSVEDRKYGLPRVDVLRKVPAACRFLSVEPMLEDLGEINLDEIGWVIVGGESGPGARPFCDEWARSIVGQCREAGVPVFVKQMGSAPTFRACGCVGERCRGGHLCNGITRPYRLRDRKGGDMAEWPEDLRVRELPTIGGASCG